ncbi:hypothetical protein A3L14_08200 [Thermococcus thioreducens]|nr:hypothetical protein A3L14_08200 [Thermococcus thioreducens]KQH82332.1 hypothetical protein AMR53_06960 [Thermococcus thioreducens]
MTDNGSTSTFPREESIENQTDKSPEERMNITLKGCPVVKRAGYENGSNLYVGFKIVHNGTVLATFNLQGVEGRYQCFHEGILLYAYYPGDPNGQTSMIFLGYNLSEKWRKTFDGLTVPIYLKDLDLFLLKRGSDGWCAQGCLYGLDIESGNTTFKFCLDCTEILDVKILEDRVYLTASDGYLYLLKGNETKRAFVKYIRGDVPGKSMKIIVKEDHVAVAYFFYEASGSTKYGMCIFTPELEKISCDG